MKNLEIVSPILFNPSLTADQTLATALLNALAIAEIPFLIAFLAISYALKKADKTPIIKVIIPSDSSAPLATSPAVENAWSFPSEIKLFAFSALVSFTELFFTDSPIFWTLFSFDLLAFTVSFWILFSSAFTWIFISFTALAFFLFKSAWPFLIKLSHDPKINSSASFMSSALKVFLL